MKKHVTETLSNENSGIIDIFVEKGADAIGITRVDFKTGLHSRMYFPIAAWTDAATVKRAAEIVCRFKW